ncbi:Alpha/Beta hydrolase protein [Chaetomium tenue]|uniref:Alpha/Beta hydrolase protein n=1 Tax=Chaetomium tenue TaxID=1854479 RepID=A0ACB7PDZ6_9PEZI|nr:Alpha/Beta hydrolase protein [Chaetomium globosum]
MRFFILACMLVGIAQAFMVTSHPGPFSVTMRAKALTDEARTDPFNNRFKRQVLLSVFWPLPNTTNCAQEVIPYMPPATAASYGPLSQSAGLPATIFESFQLDFCKLTKGCRGRTETMPRFPLILFSPGLGESRLLYSATAKSIAAQGYIVATIDHPYDAEVVEFPDGAVVRRNWTQGMEQQLTEIRAADISFALSELSHLTTSHPSSRDLPTAQIDFTRVIAMGHSVGGAAAAQALQQDRRIRGAINLDGRLFSPVLEPSSLRRRAGKTIVNGRPFLLLGREKHADEDPTWNQFWRSMLQHGKPGQPAAMLGVAGTTHSSFTDLPALIGALGLSDEDQSRVEGMLGVVRGARMQQILAELSSSFFTGAFGGGYRQLAEAVRGLEEVSVRNSTLKVL